MGRKRKWYKDQTKMLYDHNIEPGKNICFLVLLFLHVVLHVYELHCQTVNGKCVKDYLISVQTIDLVDSV